MGYRNLPSHSSRSKNICATTISPNWLHWTWSLVVIGGMSNWSYIVHAVLSIEQLDRMLFSTIKLSYPLLGSTWWQRSMHSMTPWVGYRMGNCRLPLQHSITMSVFHIVKCTFKIIKTNKTTSCYRCNAKI